MKSMMVFLFGAAVGVAAGLSWAPKDGKATRDQISSSLKDGADQLKRKGQNLSDAASSLLSKGRGQLKHELEQSAQAV